ncbi:DUF2796 domain-containing protein [Oceanisphaera sp. IT1-181]|uniref:DUF2796 domain-containing protein n=1 Tax=Oceanisphaera sp. IT1-181 TaxID=3081199 RepID=UPI0029CA6F41|nr:DUF2796 domain-containing protein [Oceanisphaera sp. IT1-181]
MKVNYYLLALPLLPLTALAQALPDVLQPSAHQPSVQQLGVHQHGFGSLSLALNQQQLVLELLAPAADIVGFEHAPQNIEQEQQQAAAFKRVQDANLLFTLPKKAECTLIESKLLAQDEEGFDEDEHASDHTHAKDDSHQDTAHAQHQDDGHEHEHEHDDQGHNDVLVQYHYQCQQPQALTSLDTQLFELFASLNKIELQGIIAHSQVAATLSPAQPRAAW